MLNLFLKQPLPAQPLPLFPEEYLHFWSAYFKSWALDFFCFKRSRCFTKQNHRMTHRHGLFLTYTYFISQTWSSETQNVHEFFFKPAALCALCYRHSHDDGCVGDILCSDIRNRRLELKFTDCPCENSKCER